ncbi:hypothetical protein Syun_003485 [Stephania yunnanensis]|uniref:Uncharacterized protein n=1 Tax=Stephania yunnanensis TaxID=152371 RepID=A0AAP0L197_9MAGN
MHVEMSGTGYLVVEGQWDHNFTIVVSRLGSIGPATRHRAVSTPHSLAAVTSPPPPGVAAAFLKPVTADPSGRASSPLPLPLQLPLRRDPCCYSTAPTHRCRGRWSPRWPLLDRYVVDLPAACTSSAVATIVVLALPSAASPQPPPRHWFALSLLPLLPDDKQWESPVGIMRKKKKKKKKMGAS